MSLYRSVYMFGHNCLRHHERAGLQLTYSSTVFLGMWEGTVMVQIHGSRVLLDKLLTFSVKKYPGFHEMRGFVTVLTTACYFSLP